MDYFKFLSKFYDEKMVEEIKKAINQKPIYGLRLNPFKIPSYINFDNLEKHPYVENDYLFDKETNQFGKYIEHDIGCFYIQDPSASMVVEILNPSKDDLILDMCAAPGGKSTQAGLLINNTIYCNDISFSRSLDLLENIERIGLDNTIILNEDPTKLADKLEGVFDKIILDAPCSGEGMFRKNEASYLDWSIDKVNNLLPIQKNLIMNAYKMLKNGGIMTYSTCTFNKLENEEIVKYLLNNTNASLIQIDNYDGLTYSNNLKETVHIFPSNFNGEGHYIALIKCNDEHNKNIKDLKGNIDNKSLSVYKKFEKECLNETYNIDRLYVVKSNLYYLPPNCYNLKNVNILKYGLYLGEVKDNYFVPSHHLGSCYKTKWKNIINLDEKQGLDYIKGLSFKINSNINGYSQVRINNNPIGVCKIVNGTLKNLYPKKLRK